MSRYADYCLKYSNRGEALEAKEQVATADSHRCDIIHFSPTSISMIVRQWNGMDESHV